MYVGTAGGRSWEVDTITTVLFAYGVGTLMTKYPAIDSQIAKE